MRLILQASSDHAFALSKDLEGPTVARIMQEFCTALGGIFFASLDNLVQPQLRDQARLLIATRLAQAYTTIYEFVQDESHGIRLLDESGAAMHVATPEQVRTVLEID